nr:thioesterase domain-containing protein [Aliiroseovarius pelagivivens]
MFNAAHEPRQLAHALGKDQPLVILRSLNQIQRASSDRYDSAEHLAAYYANQLAQTLPNNVQLVAGNCQGAPIALWIANGLLERGHDVGCAAVVDARPWVEVQLPLLLNFGIDWKEDASFGGNTPDPLEVNARFYANWEQARLHCTHGQYFDPGHVDQLANNLRRFMRQEGCWQETLQSRLARTLRTKAKGVFHRTGAFRVRDKILALSKSHLPD